MILYDPGFMRKDCSLCYSFTHLSFLIVLAVDCYIFAPITKYFAKVDQYVSSRLYNHL